jgi:hypothetical protein
LSRVGKDQRLCFARVAKTNSELRLADYMWVGQDWA